MTSFAISRLFLCCSVVLCAPVVPPEPLKKVPSSIALEFMRQYGYLEPKGADSESLYSNLAVEEAVKDVQRFGGIPETGVIDNKTLELMQSERCGVPDIIKQRNKRYVLNSGWPRRKLTYFIANWSPKIGETTMKVELQRAFEVWAKYGRLRFQEVSDPDADIIVGFSRGPHGDGYPFDGPGSILAHAFFPGEMGSFAGDIHFDDDEGWKINPGEFEDGVDFFTVAVHELGHSLGLAHSPMPESVMNPYYKRASVSSAFNLGYDDVLGMYELYIKRPLIGDTEDQNTSGNDENVDHDSDNSTPDERTSTKPILTTDLTTSRPKVTFEGDYESVEKHKNHDKMHRIPGSVPPYIPEIIPITPSSSDNSSDDVGCNGNFDAVANLRDELFIFKDEWLWRLSEPGKVMPSYPVKIQRMFQLPSTIKRIDAVYQRDSDSNIIFFAGDRYWVFNGNNFVENSPRSITDYGLPDYLSQIDAAMVWDKNKKTYLFSGNQYWRYNDTTRTMDPDYPKSITMFRGIPNNIDSALTWKDGITYFFKDKEYWAFNNTWKKTEDEYPKSSTKYLLNCSY